LDQERDLFCTRGARLAFRELDAELALPQTQAAELLCDRLGERLRGGDALRAQLVREPSYESLGYRQRLARRRGRVDPVLERLELRASLGGPGEQLVVARAAETALRLGDPVELGLDLFQPVGLGLERSEERSPLG